MTRLGERLGRAIDWTFRDRRTGGITIGQWPNLPLWLFLGLGLLAWIAPDPASNWLRLAAGAALAWWALDEVLRGVNPWRRMLGAGALIWLGASVALAVG